MGGEQSLAGLLTLLLDLPAGTPTIATPSFAGWVMDASGAGPLSPHGSSAVTGDPQGLLLVDTRDRAGRKLLRQIRPDRDRIAAALVLSGTGQPGHWLRRLVRRIRHPGMQRVPGARVLEQLDGNRLLAIRLAFDDTFEVPTDFVVDAARPSSGTAFLLTAGPPFDGPIWELIRNRVSPGVQVRRLQLRERGAAIVMIREADREYVLRVVPRGGLQEVVLRNSALLAGLRTALAGRADLLHLLPEPMFTEFVDGVAVLAETCVPGVLAWKVAEGPLADRIHGLSVGFLGALRDATRGEPRSDAAALLRPDLERVRSAGFLPDETRRGIQQLLDSAGVTLSRTVFLPSTSHGDFGYGNILVDPSSGALTGVIDWDTARDIDFPGIDRVNLEIQIARTGRSFAEAVRSVWMARSAHDSLLLDVATDRERGEWALFTLAVCRYITRALSYPAVYRREAAGFEAALSWMETTGRQMA